jgi:hypothetical protein
MDFGFTKGVQIMENCECRCHNDVSSNKSYGGGFCWKCKENHEPIKTVVGQYADYFDTGIWSMDCGRIVAPEDLTISQLKDFLLASGGAVYLRQDGKIVWIPGEQ